jgi:hypothetical protein
MPTTRGPQHPADTPELYYDYDLQVWVRDGAIEPCGHPDWLREQKANGMCCRAWAFQGLSPDMVQRKTNQRKECKE